ncbi:MAG: MFS transporter [Oligoflexales bacterium]|nr:MFS transporter [Oligoflexales bacterium]
MAKSATELIRKNHSFRMVWIGQVLSQAGLRMYQIAILWWILGQVAPDRGGQSSAMFLLLAASPSILFLKPIGQLIDRSSSKKIMAAASLLAAFFMATVSLCLYGSLASLSMIFLLGFMVAFCQACIDPTLTKSIPELVDSDDIETAVAFEASTQSLANFGGAMCGAMLIDRLGIFGVTLLTSIGYVVSSVAVASATFLPILGDQKDPLPDENSPGVWKYLEKEMSIKLILMIFAMVNFFSNPVFVVLPVYTRNILGASAAVLGQLEASLWIGLLIGAFSQRFVKGKAAISVLGSLCLFALGFCLSLPALAVSPLVYALSLFGAGMAVGINNVTFISYFQRVIHDKYRGRFFALMQGLVSVTFPVSFFMFGFLIDAIGPRKVILIQGIGILAVSIFMISRKGLIEKS